MPNAEMADASEVTSVLYGVEGWFDLPLILLALLLAVAAVAVSKRKSYLLFAAALVCFATKQAIFYLGVEPTPGLIQTQQWVGTLGWLLLLLFAGVSIRRCSDASPLAEK